MGTTLRHDQLGDGGLAPAAGFPRPYTFSVNSPGARRLDISGLVEGRAPGSDGLPQDAAHLAGARRRTSAGFSESETSERMQARGPQDLVAVDVADPGDERLVDQRRFNLRVPTRRA